MTKRTKKGARAKAKDLDPKSRAKKVKGGVKTTDVAFDRLNPNDRKNLKRATRDVTLGIVKP